MRAKDFITELKRKKKEPPVQLTPADDAYHELQLTKEVSTGKFPCNTYQLFMPRPHGGAKTAYQKHVQSLSNKYAYEPDSPEFTKSYQTWIDKHPDRLGESAPVIAARDNVPPGRNKPQAILWTSTATRQSDGTWTSDWVNWVANNQKDWMSETGYLYKVAPNATLLHLNSDYDAEDIYDTFEKMGRVKREYSTDGYDGGLSKNFPWNEIAKHFDGIHHSGIGYGNEFMYGWDVESLAIFNPAIVTLIGEVKVSNQIED